MLRFFIAFFIFIHIFFYLTLFPIFSKKRIPIDSVLMGDNVSFFDKAGNIQYQALVSKIEKGSIYVKCLDLSTADYYESKLLIENIKDLDPTASYEIEFFR